MPTIHDVERRELEVNVDERGHLVEMFRDDWAEYGETPSMSYYSVTHPGIIRAWHRHLEGQIDHFVCLSGKIKVGVYDDRDSSPTEGELDTFVIGEHDPHVIRIPGDCWHGFKALGDQPAMLANFPTDLYDYDNPDEERLPHDTDRIPLDWEESPHQ